jgi:DNA-binding HxlR family transcriptional regulator
VTASRHYADPCGIARALDAVGDRWALLIVRELIFGPQRFSQLRASLPGVSPNVLAQRLRELAAAGIVRPGLLDPPASVGVYELTARGQALEPVLLELARWGSREPVTAMSELSVSALLFALRTVFDPAAAEDATYALRAGGQWFTITVTGPSLLIARGRAGEPTATLAADVATLRSVAFGREPVSAAERDGRLTVTGDRRAAERFPSLFAVPPGPRLARDGTTSL